MSFWDDIFTWTGRPKKQIIDVNVNSKNAVWLLNEELMRMHTLMLNPLIKNSDKNIQAVWNKIDEMHKKMHELIDKTPDVDTQKQISEIQNRIIEETVLGKEQK
jgi:hypothetical protein